MNIPDRTGEIWAFSGVNKVYYALVGPPEGENHPIIDLLDGADMFWTEVDLFPWDTAFNRKMFA